VLAPCLLFFSVEGDSAVVALVLFRVGVVLDSRAVSTLSQDAFDRGSGTLRGSFTSESWYVFVVGSC
jgi:hypothetical protein